MVEEREFSQVTQGKLKQNGIGIFLCARENFFQNPGLLVNQRNPQTSLFPTYKVNFSPSSFRAEN